MTGCHTVGYECGVFAERRRALSSNKKTITLAKHDANTSHPVIWRGRRTRRTPAAIKSIALMTSQNRMRRYILSEIIDCGIEPFSVWLTDSVQLRWNE
jgi:hypothetical protein